MKNTYCPKVDFDALWVKTLKNTKSRSKYDILKEFMYKIYDDKHLPKESKKYFKKHSKKDKKIRKVYKALDVIEMNGFKY